MTFKQWVRDVFGPESRAARASQYGQSRLPWGQQRSPSFKPLMERLEDRTLLTGTPGAQAATVATDRYDYSPGATAVISGSGFAAGETVTLQVLHVDGRPNTDASHTPWTVTADADGNFQTTWTVDDVDAIDSKLDVSAVGLTSHSQADATFTDSTVQRPFWIFGHNPNSDAITNQYLSMGVNALEPDIEYFSDHASDPISKGFYIAHQVGGNPLSNYSDPTLSLHDYVTHLSQHLSGFIDQDGNFVHTNNTQLSLVEFDVKTEAATTSGALAYIISTISTQILPDHPELYFLINVGTISDGNALFNMSADDALAAIPAAERSHFGFSIDGENDPAAVRDTLRNKLGADANIAYGNGTSGCCGVYGDTAVVTGVLSGVLGLGVLEADPEIAAFAAIGFIVGQFIYAGPNVGPSLQQAVEMRAASGDFNMVAYGFSITGKDSMKYIIDSGADGMIPADSLDITSPFSIHGFSALVGGATIGTVSYGDTQDALDLVNGHYGGTRMATTADNPFAIHGATIDAQGKETVTGTRDGYDLEVKTSNVLGGGTDAKLSFTLHGEKNGVATSAAITIDSNFPQEMEKDDTNFVFIPSADLGTLKSVTVFENGDHLGSEWNLDYINVRSEAYLGKGTALHADFGGVDVGNQTCIDFGLLGTACFDTSDENPSTRGFSTQLTATSQATTTGGVEGTTAAALSAATFHDSITTTTADKFSITAADWGDGSTDTTGLTISADPNNLGSFIVNGSHLYHEDGNFAFSITVKANTTGDDNGKSATIRGEAEIDDIAVALTAGSFAATEGTLSPVQTLATFTDPGGAEALTDYAVDVDWGNGTLVTDANVSISGPDSNGVFSVTGQHLYADEDGYPGPVRVRIDHEQGRTTEDGTPNDVVSDVSVPLTLTDPPASAIGASGPFLATEGTMSAVQTLATFTDPGGTETNAEYSVDVDWGNGTFVSGDANVSFSGPVAGVFTVTGKHLYIDEDGYTGDIRVRVNHEDSIPIPVSVPLILTDPPVIAAGTSFAVVRGSDDTHTVATFTDPGGAEPNHFGAVPLSNDYTANIHWGDGSPDDAGVITYNGIPLDDSPTNTFTVSNHHDYTANGTYTITVTIHHEGAVPDATVTTKVTVATLLNHASGFFDTNSLVIGAVLSGSIIRVVPVGKQTGALTDTVQVVIDGKLQINPDTGGTTFTGFNSITIYGQAGNDDVEVTDGVKKNAALFGRDGNDRLKGGAGNDMLSGDGGNDRLFGGKGNNILIGGVGNDQLFASAGNNVLVGGDGNDKLFGGAGRDLLIGGAGRDQLFAGAGGDILVGSSTVHDENQVALAAILAEWASKNSYVARVNNIRNGGGANGAFVLNSTTMIDDGSADLLYGGSGKDWFWIGGGRKVNGRTAGEIRN